MAAVLLVAADESRRTRLRRALGEHSVLTTGTDVEALQLARYVDLDVVVRDAPGSPRGVRELAAGLRQACPAALMMVVGAAGEDVELEARLAADVTAQDLETAVARAIEKQRLLRELAFLRARTPARPPDAPVDDGRDALALGRAVKALARAFAGGFDLPRTLETFLDAVAELVRPARMALLLPDATEQSFRIIAHRGVPAAIVASIHLPVSGELARWLRASGRPARQSELGPDLARELTLVRAVVAVPLLAHGELVGILGLGPPVVRPGYADHEIETLFDLATHLATTTRDITLHHRLAVEKEFSERILAHMASGVITIDRRRRVGTINRRAEEILALAAQDVVGEDLRRLPSPLGDMLDETLASGEGRARTEVPLALGARVLDVSTYPVRGDGPEPLGAVLVFEDLTAQQQRQAQRRQAEQRELLARVIARIADEIKNPLVSISTFVELLDERVDDAEFRKDFSAVVRRDARRLVEVFETLAGLVNGGELHATPVDIATVVDDLVAAIECGDESPGRPVQIEVIRDAVPRTVTVDVTRLRRAFSYLVWYLAHATPAEPARVSISIGRGAESSGPETVRVMVASRTARVTPETLEKLFDPVQMVQESLIDVGPAVSQRIVEALGGQLRVQQGRHELAFLVTLRATS